MGHNDLRPVSGLSFCILPHFPLQRLYGGHKKTGTDPDWHYLRRYSGLYPYAGGEFPGEEVHDPCLRKEGDPGRERREGSSAQKAHAGPFRIDFHGPFPGGPDDPVPDLHTFPVQKHHQPYQCLSLLYQKFQEMA